MNTIAGESYDAGKNASRESTSVLRLYALRAVYLLIAVVLLSRAIGNLTEATAVPASVARAMFTAVGLLAIIGLRYPLQMLPLLFFEVAWKAVWLAAFGLPLWLAGKLDPVFAQATQEVAMGMIIVLVVLPWGYMVDRYVRRPSDPWLIGRR